MSSFWTRIADAARRVILWGDRHIPRGLRSLAGILLIGGGIVGFLPILGFWMIPAGLAMIALDIPVLRGRVLAWCRRHASDAAAGR
jgi:hypothetical protein